MSYKVYIDAKIKTIKGTKWLILESLPKTGTYITRMEADAQAKDNLNWWRKHHKKGKLRGKYQDFRSRVVKRK